jgi:hypothetical protein
MSDTCAQWLYSQRPRTRSIQCCNLLLRRQLDLKTVGRRHQIYAQVHKAKALAARTRRLMRLFLHLAELVELAGGGSWQHSYFVDFWTGFDHAEVRSSVVALLCENPAQRPIQQADVQTCLSGIRELRNVIAPHEAFLFKDRLEEYTKRIFKMIFWLQQTM